ncbi:MAG: hypothetical protein AB7P03_17785 [Kofleriaceae bacterium]
MRPAQFALLICSACTATAEPGPSSPGSLREQLVRPVRCSVSADDSTGVVAAERRLPSGGWDAAWVDLAIEDGELVVVAEEAGMLAVQRWEVSIRAIDLPHDIFDAAAQITGIRVELAAPARVVTSWLDDERARATGVADLALSWRLTIGDAQLQLGAPELRDVPIELSVTGIGNRAEVQLRLHAMGELWSWADIVRLGELRMVLDAYGQTGN